MGRSSDVGAVSVETPFGWLTLREAGGALTSIEWRKLDVVEETPLLLEAVRQLGEYCDGDRRAFELPLAQAIGTAGQFREALLAIPLGETRTYGDIAADLGLPAQAVGQLCGQNPIPIIVPCHRVLAATGLGGFSGARGIESKVALLRHEGAASLLI